MRVMVVPSHQETVRAHQSTRTLRKLCLACQGRTIGADKLNTAKLLEDQVVVITGAGRPGGMGQAAVAKFAEVGAQMVVTDRVRETHADADLEQIEKVADRARAHGVEALAMGVDVTRREQVRACIEQTVKHFGRLDVLVNNAGTAAGAGPLLEQSDAQWEQSFRVHLMGTLYFCQEAIPVMQNSGGGVIVNNASMLGLAAEALTGAYTATKFGVVGLTKVIAAEFGKDNIRCNCVCPGSIKTLMQRETMPQFAQWAGVSVEEAWQDAERNALGRSAEPEEVANVMVFLASPMSSFVSGVALPVTGAADPGL